MQAMLILANAVPLKLAEAAYTFRKCTFRQRIRISSVREVMLLRNNNGPGTQYR